jgi:hypothetical protein
VGIGFTPGTSLTSGYGSGGAPSAAPVLHQFIPGEGGSKGILTLRAQVQSLAGCLSVLPDRLRLVLQLRTGIGVRHALGPAALARYLHVNLKDIPPLEKRAIHILRLKARTHACAASATPTQPIAFIIGAGLGEGAPGTSGAMGGVDAARYAQPAPQGRPGPEEGDGLGGTNALGISRPSAGDGVLRALVLVLVGMLLIAVLFADELGFGPRLRLWQSRWRRPPR